MGCFYVDDSVSRTACSSVSAVAKIVGEFDKKELNRICNDLQNGLQKCLVKNFTISYEKEDKAPRKETLGKQFFGKCTAKTIFQLAQLYKLCVKREIPDLTQFQELYQKTRAKTDLCDAMLEKLSEQSLDEIKDLLKNAPKNSTS